MIGTTTLNGRFGFKVIGQDGRVKFNDSFSNFITTTGLSFPKKVAFADCFRYVSLGTGSTANWVTGVNETTGLDKPSQYTYIGGNREGFSDLSLTNTGNEYVPSACGYREHLSGVSLFRGWRIPTGDLYFESGIVFKEFMVSPGKPSVGGNCYGYSEPGAMQNVYPSGDGFTTCDLDKAFARILKNITVISGDALNVFYQLDISLNTGISSFSFSPSLAAKRIVEDDEDFLGGETRELYDANWASPVTGCSRVLHHGLKVIYSDEDGGEIADKMAALSPTHAGETLGVIGESIPVPMGWPLEPSCKSTNYSSYITQDNTHLTFHPGQGGPLDTGVYFPYNETGLDFITGWSSGLATYHPQIVQEVLETIPDDSFTKFIGISNIRRFDANVASNPIPYHAKTGGFSSGATWEEMGYSSSNPASLESTNVAISFSETQPYVTGRTRRREINFQFPNTSFDSFRLKPIRGSVLAFNPSSNNRANLYAFMDNLYVSRTGEFYLNMDTGSLTYHPCSESGWNYGESHNNINTYFAQEWSAPCPPDVSGCT